MGTTKAGAGAGTRAYTGGIPLDETGREKPASRAFVIHAAEGDGAAEHPDGERPGHTAVLHPHLYRHRPRLRLAEVRKAPDEPRESVSARIADRIVDHRRNDDQEPRRGEGVAARRGQGEDRVADAGHRQH